ncbi:MAG: hypothetical protein KJ718_01020 [Nanoarchaeota archaeon]|nr:hypothetical protein [Nanoarchaeota archaeon]MBU1051117.1 hypothetical protein [Nanoarchaeota archaeon]MBU1988407.1 hypothetical protein [Nanoarchaeota archaeon]
MSTNNAVLANLVVLVTNGINSRYGQIARVIWYEKTKEDRPDQVIEFADGKRQTVRPESESFRIFHRYCRSDEETAQCVREQRDLVSLRNRFCEMNGVQPSVFAGAYGKLFFKF